LESRINLESIETYKEGSLKVLNEKLEGFFGSGVSYSLDDVKKYQDELNKYVNFDSLEDANMSSDVFILDKGSIDISAAEDCILEGKFFWEHTCAGEATRLGLGTKYLLRPARFTRDFVTSLLEKQGAEYDFLIDSFPDPKELIDLSLGQRHILQIVYDIKKLCLKRGVDFDTVIFRQKMLLVLNKKTADEILSEWEKNKFYGFNSENIFFMVQEDFHGISIVGDSKGCGDERVSGGIRYVEEIENNKRLHNHGQMLMQKMHEKTVFRYISGVREYLTSLEYLNMLSDCLDMLSFNIEDLGYLTGSIDYLSLAKALELGNMGYGMVMEVVGQNEKFPQKGGALFFDSKLGRNVMIESFALGDIPAFDIKYLNKNFNHYPNPFSSMKVFGEKSLPMSVTVKVAADGKEYLYFKPAQGDMNFLVKTAYVMRSELKPIKSWKSATTTPDAIRAMMEQDKQDGFIDIVSRYLSDC